MKFIRGSLLIIGATICWGLSATGARFLFTRGVDPLELVQLRTFISCIVLVSVLALFRRHVLSVKPRDLYRFALLGIAGIAGSNITYYMAISLTNVSTAILLQYLAPLIVVGYAAMSREEPMTPSLWIGAAVSLGGCFLAVGGGNPASLHLNGWGVAAGLGAACCWAFTNIWMKRVLRDYSTDTVLVYALLSGSVFWALIRPPWLLLSDGYSGWHWQMFLAIAMGSVLVPQLLYFSGAKLLTASGAIITASFEPVAAIGSAYLFLGESLTALQVAGAALVILAIVVVEQSRRYLPELQG